MQGTSVMKTPQLCTGCGVCAGICKCISMRKTSSGHYAAEVDANKCVNCGRCAGVCPVLKSGDEKSALNSELFKGEYTNETGHFVSCYRGISRAHVKSSASGGLCTALLEELLRKKAVDGIYCVGSDESKEAYYKYTLVSSVENLKKYSLSAYCPVNLESVVRKILKEDKTVAVVALPCQAQALRFAAAQDKRLKQRIKYIIGLVCGGLPGSAMIDYIAAKDRIRDIDKVTFREKSEDKVCNNCSLYIYHGTDVHRHYYHNDIFGTLYFGKGFHGEACNICTDIFAEAADIAFGDAWYNENKKNVYGESICIVRNEELNKLLLDTDNLELRSISVDELILAQRNVGLIWLKRQLPYAFEKIYRSMGYKNGKLNKAKQISPIAYAKLYPKAVFKLSRQRLSVKYWKKYKDNEISFDCLEKKIKLIGKLLNR